MKWLLLVCFLLRYCKGESPVRQCYATSKDPYQYFGTNSAYKVSHAQVDETVQDKEVSGCEAKNLWLVARPGPSWPTGSLFRRLLTLPKLQEQIIANQNNMTEEDRMCAADLDKLQSMQFPPEGTEEGSLTEEGKRNAQDLASTLKQKYPTFFEKPNTVGIQRGSNMAYTDKHNFEISDGISYKQATEAFVEQLVGEALNTSLLEQYANEKNILDIQEHCPEWKKKAHTKGCLSRIKGLFYTRPLEKMRTAVSQRLGFKTLLDDETLVNMYLGCALQQAIQPTGDHAWCSVFTPEELMSLSKQESDFYYNACGPGGDKGLNKRLAFYLLSRLNNIATNPGLSGFFVNVNTFYLIVNALSLVDVQPTDYLPSLHEPTLSTRIAPFGANLLAVYYKCPGKDDERSKVGFYLQESLTDEFGEQKLTSWKEFVSNYRYFYYSQMPYSEKDCSENNETEEDISQYIFS